MLNVGDGGGRFVKQSEVDSLLDDAGFMGAYPIGSDCWRKHKAELQQYLDAEARPQ